MASIIDSFREVFSDNLAALKVIVLSIPLFYSYQLFVQAKGDYSGFTWMAILTFMLLFGFLIGTAHNIISESDAILPSLNPIKLLFNAVKGVLAIGPTILVWSWLANYITSLIYIIPWLDITLKVIIWIIVAAVILTALLTFCRRQRISDAYNLKFIFEKAGDLIVVVLVFILQLLMINLPTTGFIGYVLLLLFGFGPVFDFYIALVVVFNLGVLGHYLGQVNYEALGA